MAKLILRNRGQTEDLESRDSIPGCRLMGRALALLDGPGLAKQKRADRD